MINGGSSLPVPIWHQTLHSPKRACLRVCGPCLLVEVVLFSFDSHLKKKRVTPLHITSLANICIPVTACKNWNTHVQAVVWSGQNVLRESSTRSETRQSKFLSGLFFTLTYGEVILYSCCDFCIFFRSSPLACLVRVCSFLYYFSLLMQFRAGPFKVPFSS